MPMNAHVVKLAERIVELERELEREVEKDLAAKRREFRYRLEHGKAAFEKEMCDFHDKIRQSWLDFLVEAPLPSLLVAPAIYSLIVPLVLLDAWLWLYQSVCFPVYGIAKAERSRYIVYDRGRLPYLNWIERFNCQYCSYANGLIAYAREIASRSELYFCPIKSAQRRAGVHPRYHEFLDFGDAAAYRRELMNLRKELRP